MENKKVYIFLGLLLLLAISLSYSVFASTEENLKVMFYDVGQGDAIHIRIKNQDVLIDGGPDSSIISKLDANLPFYDQTIELMVLTHPHADHITGLLDVLEKYEVQKVLYAGSSYESDIYSEWKGIIEEREIDLIEAYKGQILRLDGANLYVIYPNAGDLEVENINNASIVSKLVYGQTSFLFTGDAEREVEKELITAKIDLQSDVVKIGHHGSKTASTKDFIDIIDPEYSIISAGKNNKFNHPHAETLETLNSLEINTLRTDMEGDIYCVSDSAKVNCN